MNKDTKYRSKSVTKRPIVPKLPALNLDTRTQTRADSKEDILRSMPSKKSNLAMKESLKILTDYIHKQNLPMPRLPIKINTGKKTNALYVKEPLDYGLYLESYQIDSKLGTKRSARYYLLFLFCQTSGIIVLPLMDRWIVTENPQLQWKAAEVEIIV